MGPETGPPETAAFGTVALDRSPAGTGCPGWSQERGVWRGLNRCIGLFAEEIQRRWQLVRQLPLGAQVTLKQGQGLFRGCPETGPPRSCLGRLPLTGCRQGPGLGTLSRLLPGAVLKHGCQSRNRRLARFESMYWTLCRRDPETLYYHKD